MSFQPDDGFPTGETEGGRPDRDALPAALREATGFGTRQQFWEAVRCSIRDRLGRERYSVWFQNTELLRADERALVVGVPNLVIQQFLTASYAEAVGAAAEEMTGREMAVRFEVAPRLFRQMRAEQRAELEQDEDERPVPFRRPHAGPPVGSDWGFERLIATRSNALAFAAARELAGQENPRVRFLYVCGDYGVGKTALLRAIYALAVGPGSTLEPAMMPAETWCNDFYHAIQQKTTRAFRSRYRPCRLFVLDDVQFIEGKAGAQAELLHTVKHILAEGGRAVLAGVSHPDQLQEVDDGLRAMLKTAFPAVLVPPGEGERPEVARELAGRHGLAAEPEVHQHIARLFGRSFAEMESAIKCLALYAGVHGCGRMDLEAAAQALASLRPARALPLGLPQIKKAVLDAFPVRAEELTGRSRTRTVCRARHVALYLARSLTGASLTEIGRFFGGFSHSTVKHAVDKIGRQVRQDQRLRTLVERIEQRLTAA